MIEKYKLKLIHHTLTIDIKNNKNGTLYFLVNNRILELSYKFDFLEKCWTLHKLLFSDYPVDFSSNFIKLEPINTIPSIYISKKEYDFLSIVFSKNVSIDIRIESFTKKYPDEVTPYSYINPFYLLRSYVKEGVLMHEIRDNASISLHSHYIKASCWRNKKDIVSFQGLYNLLIPLMEKIVSFSNL